jgi:hypothetical protein
VKIAVEATKMIASQMATGSQRRHAGRETKASISVDGVFISTRMF